MDLCFVTLLIGILNDGSQHRKRAKNPIEHPLPSIDQGKRLVDCTTDLSSYEIEHVANMLVKVKATPAQEIGNCR